MCLGSTFGILMFFVRSISCLLLLKNCPFGVLLLIWLVSLMFYCFFTWSIFTWSIWYFMNILLTPFGFHCFFKWSISCLIILLPSPFDVLLFLYQILGNVIVFPVLPSPFDVFNLVHLIFIVVYLFHAIIVFPSPFDSVFIWTVWCLLFLQTVHVMFYFFFTAFISCLNVSFVWCLFKWFSWCFIVFSPISVNLLLFLPCSSHIYCFFVQLFYRLIYFIFLFFASQH